MFSINYQIPFSLFDKKKESEKIYALKSLFLQMIKQKCEIEKNDAFNPYYIIFVGLKFW